jgi:RNA polymerase sigma factor (sigma-70 family)
MNPDEQYGPNAKIEALWSAHHEVLERAIAGWTHRPTGDPDVQEAIAATFDRALRFLHGGNAIDVDPRAWLLTVARREFLRIIGRTYNRASELYADDRAAGLIDPARQPEDVVLDHAQRSLDGALATAMSRLTLRQRVVLFEVHAGYSYAEIQQRHDLSYSALNKALTSARTKLRNDADLQNAYRDWSD